MEVRSELASLERLILTSADSGHTKYIHRMSVPTDRTRVVIRDMIAALISLGYGVEQFERSDATSLTNRITLVVSW